MHYVFYKDLEDGQMGYYATYPTKQVAAHHAENLNRLNKKNGLRFFIEAVVDPELDGEQIALTRNIVNNGTKEQKAALQYINSRFIHI